MTPFDLMQLIDRMRDTAIVVTDPTLDAPGPRIRFVNDAFLGMARYERDAVLGGTPRMFQGQATDLRRARTLGDRLRAGCGHREVLVNYRADGEPYNCAIEVCPVRDDDGRIVAFAAFETEVERRRGRPAGGAFGRWRRVGEGSRLMSEVAPSLWLG